MNAKFNIVYDQLFAVLPTLTGFSQKTEIPNPYSLPDNNTNFLKNGYGIIVGDATPDLSEFSSFAESQDFTVVFTKEVRGTENNPSALVNAIKDIKQDAKELKTDILNVDQLEIETAIEKVDLGGTSEITFISADKFNFIALSVTFSIVIRERL